MWEARRTVLLEDFTGQNCINCPAAHEVIEQLQLQYGDNLIPVSVHAGNFGFSVDYTNYDYNLVGLMQPEGTRMSDAWGITTFPMGVIDRTGSPLEADSWAAAVRDRVAAPTGLAIGVEAAFADPAERNFDIDITFAPAADINGTLHVWVLESGIVAFQRTTTTRIPDYVHNNVYRASVNSYEGEPIALEAHIHATRSYSVAVRDTEHERWNPANLSVVAFVQTSAGVVQAARAKVAPYQASGTEN